MANNIDRAIKLCNENASILPRVIKAGLTRANRSEKEIEAAMEEASLEAGPLVNKRIRSCPCSRTSRPSPVSSEPLWV